MRSPPSLLLAFLCVVLACVPAPRTPLPARLLSVAFEDGALDREHLSRMPSLALRFDQPLSPPEPDAIWVLRGAVSASLRTQSERGELTNSDAARRVPAVVTLAPEQPELLMVRVTQPLRPDEAIALVSSSKLTTVQGARALAMDEPAGPIMWSLRVAPARRCRPLAALRVPARSDVPRALVRVVVVFDRPVWPREEGAVASLALSDGTLEPSRAEAGCGDVRTGFRCVVCYPRRILAPETSYVLRLGKLTDDAGLAPQGVELGFRTGVRLDAPPPDLLDHLACAADEAARPPFCVREAARATELRAAAAPSAALMVARAGAVAFAPIGTDLRVWLPHLEPAAEIPIEIVTLGQGGEPVRRDMLDAPAARGSLARLRITEVLARPRRRADQEFVEIVNEERSPVELGGLTLATRSGSSRLPAATLAPGARALLVGSDFDPRGDPLQGEPATAPGATLVRLPAALARAGLLDRGDDVWLAGADGRRISFAPGSAMPTPPAPGVSLVRADFRMEEDDPASWTYDPSGGSSPGLPERLR